MKSDLRFEKMNSEWARFRLARHSEDQTSAWASLERAHILSQIYPWAHTRVHFDMLMYAVNTRSWREVIGQIPRLLLAGIGSLLGSAPRGNPGTVRVGIFQRTPIPNDLLPYLVNKN